MPELRRPKALRLVFGALVVAIASGCASKRDIRDLQMELRALTARQDTLLVQLRRDALTQARSTQDTLRTQGNQLVDLRGEIMRQLREITQSLATLQALAGENQRSIAAVRDQLLNPRGSGTAPRPQVRDSVAPAGGAPQQGASPEAVYNAAVGQFNRGSTSTARRAFEQFLQSYPNHALAPEARFFLADMMVQENRLEDALAGFQEIPARFPTSDTVPRALYRSALIQIELDRIEEAVDTLERIVNTYPETGSALLARDKLEEIR